MVTTFEYKNDLLNMDEEMDDEDELGEDMEDEENDFGMGDDE